MLEETGRLFACARCGERRLLCPRCDHGNVYCGEACSRARRRETLRRASATYQGTGRGARLHAARMQRLRDRRRVANFSASKVTHHGLTWEAIGVTTGGSPAIDVATLDSKEDADDRTMDVCAATFAERIEAAGPSSGAGGGAPRAAALSSAAPARPADGPGGRGDLERPSTTRESRALSTVSTTPRRRVARSWRS